jgi:hypothetical protein
VFSAASSTDEDEGEWAMAESWWDLE